MKRFKNKRLQHNALSFMLVGSLCSGTMPVYGNSHLDTSTNILTSIAPYVRRSIFVTL